MTFARRLMVAGCAALLALMPWWSAGAAGPTAPATISPLGPGQTQGKIAVELVKGMWSEHWKFDEALATPAGQFGVTSSYVTQRYGYVFALKYFPENKAEFMKQKVVVLGNVPTTAFLRAGPRNAMKAVAGRSDQWLADFVEQGGGLFVLGGSFSFDLEITTPEPGKGFERNTYKDSALAKILPVELGAKGMRFEDQNKPLELKPAGNHVLLKNVSFKDHPVTLFYHPMEVKKEGVVILTAGGAPVMVVGTYGKGRVVVFLATLHGDPAKDVTPYWESAAWPVLVRNTVSWLAGQ